MPKIFKTLDDPELQGLLMAGSVGVIPTDTVYGLVCRAADEKAVGRLYKLKLRERKPGTVIAADINQLTDLGIKARYLKAVEHFWPGSVSVIIPSRDLEYIHVGLQGIAVRAPDHARLNALLQKTGPLLTSSANQPGKPPANTIAEAKAYFGDSPDFYVDGGDLSGHKPSTVIRVVDDAIEVVRPGAVTIDEATGRVVK
jgi:L-threonylcarbamoyladenylate synthase